MDHEVRKNEKITEIQEVKFWYQLPALDPQQSHENLQETYQATYGMKEKSYKTCSKVWWPKDIRTSQAQTKEEMEKQCVLIV